MEQLQRREALRRRRPLPLRGPLHRRHGPLQLGLLLLLGRGRPELRRAVDVGLARPGKGERRRTAATLSAVFPSTIIIVVVGGFVAGCCLGRVLPQEKLQSGDRDALVGVRAAAGDGVGGPRVPPQPAPPELRQQAQRRARRRRGLVRGRGGAQGRLRRPVEPVVAPLRVAPLDVGDDVGADEPAQALVLEPQAPDPEREELLGRDGAAVAQEHEGLGQREPERRVHRRGRGRGQKFGEATREGLRGPAARVAGRDGGEEGGEVAELAVRARGLEGEDVEAGRVAAELCRRRGLAVGGGEREGEREREKESLKGR